MKSHVLEYLKNNSKDERIKEVSRIALETGKTFMEVLKEYDYSINTSDIIIDDFLIRKV